MFGELYKWLANKRADTSAPEHSWVIKEQDDTPPLIYAVGDVHGCARLLAELEEKILADAARHPHSPVLIMLGDYIDRGDNSCRVINHLLTPCPAGITRICLAGNHEDMFLKFLSDPSRHWSWLDLGGWETLLSYGINPQLLAGNKLKDKRLRDEIEALIPDAHFRFLQDLCLIQRFGALVFAHAGIDRSVPIETQQQKNVLWMTNRREDDRPPYLLVHGHVPQREAFVSPYRLGVDTGAFQSGKLSAVKIVDGKFAGVLST